MMEKDKNEIGEDINEVSNENSNNQQVEGTVDNINVATVAMVEPEYVPIDDDTLAKMSREDIKEQLRICQQKLGGHKKEMLDRLKKALEEMVAVVGAKKKGQPPKKKKG